MAWTVDSLTYTKRKKLTIDHTKVGATLSNFPVLVKLTSSRLDFSKANSDGFDVRFTASDGTTLLKYERERHDSANSLAEYWVKIPSVSSSTDTEFYIYYRTTDTADGADPTNVWDSDFKAVYHLKDDPNTSTCQDSTTNNKDVTKKGANEPIEATGKIAKGQQFDGSNDYGTISGNLLQNASACFIEFLAKFSPDNSEECPIACYKDDNDRWLVYLSDINTTTERLAMGRSVGGAWGYVAHTGTNLGKNGLSDGNFHHIFIYFNGSGTGKIYVDGVDKTNSSGAISGLPNITTNTTVGDYPDATHRYFKGVLDELRISNVARSIAFGIASYNSEADTLLTYGSEETNYDKTLTETIKVVPAYSRVLTISKIFTDVVKVVSSKISRAIKTFTASLSVNPSFSRVASFTKTITETIIASDVFSKIATFLKTLIEVVVVAPIQATILTANRIFSEVIKVSGSILRSVGRTIENQIIIGDNLVAQKIFIETYSEIIKVISGISFSVSRIFSEIIITSGNYLFSISKTFAESIGLTEFYEKQVYKIRTFSETISICCDKFYISSRSFIERMIISHSPAGLVRLFTFIERIIGSTSWLFEKTQFIELTDSVKAGVAFIKDTGRVFVQTIKVAGNFTQKVARVFAETISVAFSFLGARAYEFLEAISVVGSMANFTIAKLLKEVAKVGIIFTEGRNIVFNEIVSVVSSLVSLTNKIFTEIIRVSSNLTRSIGKILTQFVKMVDSVRFRKTQYKTLSDSVKASVAIVKSIGRSILEAFPVSDSLGGWNIGKVITQNIKVVSEFLKEWTLSRVFSEIISVSSSMFNQAGKIFSEVISATDEFIRGALGKALYEVVKVYEDLTKTWTLSRVYEEIIKVGSEAYQTSIRVFSETVSVVGTFVFGTISKVLIEIVNVAQSVYFSISRILTEFMVIVGRSFNQGGKIFSEVVSVVSAMGSFVIGKLLTEVVSVGSSIVRTISRTFSQVISVVDTTIKYLPGRIFAENPKVANPNIAKLTGRVFSETLKMVMKIKLVLNGIRVGLWKKVARVSTGAWKKIGRTE